MSGDASLTSSDAINCKEIKSDCRGMLGSPRIALSYDLSGFNYAIRITYVIEIRDENIAIIHF